MSEGTPEDFARLAAAIRGESQTREAEEGRTDNPPEPEAEDTEAQEFIERLFQPKQADIDLIRLLHPDEGGGEE
jgi:hypothetical protein